MTTAAIVQARSAQFQDKDLILQPLGSKSALIRVLDRCARIAGVDQVICTIPESEVETQLALEILRNGHLLSVGPDSDPLADLTHAVQDYGVETVVLVSAASPFVDPAICAKVLELYKTARADYACNNMPALFPQGLECEVFPAVLAAEADRIAREDYAREDATLWMREHVYLQKANLRGPGGGLESLNWSVTNTDELQFARMLFNELGEGAGEASAAEIAALCLRRPDLVGERSDVVGEANPVEHLRADIESAVASLKIAA
ncbi:NTP transferase domain-containing protein [Maricaulis sp.]|uniref:NTP transferase domain-containing protein n=1 Tax=Maricaulis sp. TaxID=1486257 RepID=UPI00262B2E2D|nr:NTP transferase domain-containing protein [Maricaulis sp.]